MTTAAVFRRIPSIYAAIYLLSQDDFTTRLALRLAMPAETNGSVTAMSGTSIRKRIPSSAVRFGQDLRGNIAPIFAIALLPLLGFVGAAVDYTRANAARSSMQAAMDSAVLMVSKDAAANPTMTSQQITDAAQRYFSALYHDADAFNVTVNATYTPSTSSAAATILASGTGAIKTDFMKVVGFPQLNFGTSSTSTWGNSRMRVAMVLDNTGSMAQNGKMSALISAAKDMVDTLSGYNKNTGDIYISLIPFAKDVNVNGVVGSSYIKWSSPTGTSNPDTWDENNGTCSAGSSYKTMPACVAISTCSISGYSSKSSCTSAGTCSNSSYTTQSACTAGGTCSKSKYTTQSQCTSKSGVWTSGNYTWTAGVWGSAKWTPNNHNTWSGCVMDRDQSYDIQNEAAVPGDTNTPSSLFPAQEYTQGSTNYCKTGSNPYLQPIMPMTNDWSTLKTAIGNMQPTGGTNQAIGLAWGWQSLSTTNGPIQAPAKDSTHIYQDYLVLLSDGLNTQDRWPAYGNGNTQYTCSPGNVLCIDARQEALCQAAKVAGVTIFTVQVNIGNVDPTSQVLQDCASNGNFQMITSANQTAGAFQNILTQISQLRIAK
ncbi:TadE/TadG family type IV pilus assembly protein [Nitrobacter sp. NHB1]|uniref:TadE/TadG family type IV pilus assembly protein n=1 Tax=Nitrobacter sp. NHB1 TaxID=3119830 RepID=UPI0030000421